MSRLGKRPISLAFHINKALDSWFVNLREKRACCTWRKFDGYNQRDEL